MFFLIKKSLILFIFFLISSLYIFTQNNYDTITVKGKEIYLKKLNISGNREFGNDKINSFFENILHRNILEEDLSFCIHNLISEYENTGYPYAEVDISGIYLKKGIKVDSAEIDLKVNEREKIIIKDLRISGNEHTKPYVIHREMPFRPGTIYNLDMIKTIPYKLNKLNLFKKIDDPFLTKTDSGGILNINILEDKPNYFDGILGYNPSVSDNSPGYLNGIINLSFGNLFGTGRKMKIYWKKENRNDEQFDLQYFEPWILNFPVNVSLNFNQRKFDTIMVKRNLSLVSSFGLFEFSAIYASLNYENNIPGKENLLIGSYRNKSYSFAFEIIYDTRNKSKLSEKGALYSSRFEYGIKLYSNSGINDKGFRKYSLCSELYNNTLGSHVLYNSINGIILWKDDLEVTDMIFMGGINTMRGYGENQIILNRVIWLNNEYRIHFDEFSTIFPFIDAGYYFRNSTKDGYSQIEEFIYSYGFGLTVSTQVGLLKVIYGIGKGTTITRGHLHFGIVSSF